MQRILIKKDGIVFSFWEEQGATWIDKDIADSMLPISWYLPYSVEIEKGVTLKDFLLNLVMYSELIQLIFANQLSGITMQQIISKINDSDFTKKELPINTLYLFKIGEITEIPNVELPNINLYPVLVGMYVKDDGIDDDSVYYLSAIDVRNWMNHYLEIDDFIEFTNSAEAEVELNGTIHWTFFEMLSTILFQVAISLQVKKAIVTNVENRLASGPLLVDELFGWLEDLDNILLAT